MLKETYILSKQKKKTRDLCFNSIDFTRFRRLVGLPGPDFNEYVRYFSDKGVKDMLLYEKERSIYKSQKERSIFTPSGTNVILLNSNVINAPFDNRYFYDLDFMTTIKNNISSVEKFTDNFIFTFAIRGITLEETCKIFLRHREEIFITIENILIYPGAENINVRVLHSNKRSYKILTYRDGMPMCCITKL